jgi:glycosyltransferase involved in cell wall biosynthesis
MPFLQNCVGVLDHPTPVDRLQIEHKGIDPPIQFGYLGRATEKKGFSEFLSVAYEISKRFSDQVKFHHVGPLSDNVRNANHSKIALLNEIPGKEELRRNEYIDRLKSLHFACLFHDKYYESCASGVLLDCIALGKPIIATKLPIFETIEQSFGDIGYLCGKNEFSDTISAIIQNRDYERYKRQVTNMRQVKASRIPETLAIKYRELVNCLNN